VDVAILDGADLARLLFDSELVHDPLTYLRGFGYEPPPYGSPPVDRAQLQAEVWAGVWIWRCPCGLTVDGAAGGGVVWRDDPIGWCPSCQSGWRLIVLPSERAEIEAVLSLRPRRSDRNWTTETVRELVDENREHGDAVPWESA
jgi:hypothetical protein